MCGQTRSGRERAVCHAVLAAEHGRRPKASLREMDRSSSARLLRRAWPIPDLHPNRRHSQLANRLADTCRCFDVQLSRIPRDLLALLQAVAAPAVAAVA